MDRTSTSWTLSVRDTQDIRDYAYDVARMSGASRELAEDVAQTTMVRLFEAAGRGLAINEILASSTRSAYVASATRNVLAGYHRSEARRLRREESEAAATDRLASETHELDELEAVLLIEQLSVELTPEERAIVHLRYFLGRTIKEIAELIGTTPARVSHVGRSANRKIAAAIMRSE